MDVEIGHSSMSLYRSPLGIESEIKDFFPELQELFTVTWRLRLTMPGYCWVYVGYLFTHSASFIICEAVNSQASL